MHLMKQWRQWRTQREKSIKTPVGKTIFLLFAGGLALTACGGSSSGVSPAPTVQKIPPAIFNLDADGNGIELTGCRILAKSQNRQDR